MSSYKLQKIKIISNNISYGPPPEPDDEVEQRLTINSNGQVWFRGYLYGDGFENYKLGRSSNLKIPKEKAVHLLSLVDHFMNNNQDDLFATDIGSWKMTVIDSEGKSHELIGSLCGGVEAYDINLSRLIRMLIPIKRLFVFDGGETEYDALYAGILGSCVGDALGVPVEFMSRGALKLKPVTTMMGYGTYNMPIGTWSDDTSLTLCLLDSLSDGLDYDDLMKKFVSWYKEGAYTQYGEAFDIGTGTREAIQRYLRGMEPLECGGRVERDNGNGSLMRILPLLFYLHSDYGDHFYHFEEAFDVIHEVSALTHGHPRSQIACGIYLTVASMLIDEADLREAVRSGIERAAAYYQNSEAYQNELKVYSRLMDPAFEKVTEDDIKSSGYVVDTLEAAIWCLLNTDSYASCVLKAVNLGEDTDTVAAVAGGLAGLYYGLEGIPEEWLEAIPKIENIEAILNRL